jgi:hypothetical protein
MNTEPRERISIDLQGLKTPLVARATATGRSPSEVVRRALEQALGAPAVPKEEGSPLLTRRADELIRLCLRMAREDVQTLRVAAKRAGLSSGEYVAGLEAGVPVLTMGGSRTEHIAALTSSNAELSALSRNIHALTRFLTLSNVLQALVYRDMLDTLDGDVRRHLALAAAQLADLQPCRRAVDARRRHHRLTKEGTHRSLFVYAAATIWNAV